MDINPFPGSRAEGGSFVRGRRSESKHKGELYSLDVHRSLPASHEAEQGCLCSLLLAPAKSVEMCESLIKPEYLNNAAHRILYETIVGLHHAGTPTDIITLTGELQKARTLEAAGGPAYLAELQTIIPTAANLLFYLELIVEHHHKRELIRAAGEVLDATYEGVNEDLLEASKTMADAIGAWREKIITGPEDPTDRKGWFDLMDDLENRYDKVQKGELQGIPTGIRWLDQMSQGLQPGTFYYIGGLPSEGKSALLSQIAVCSSRSLKPNGQGHKSLIFSIEMSRLKFMERMLAQDKAISSGALKSALYTESDFGKISHTVAHLRDHIFIYAKRLAVSEIRSAIKRALAKHPDLDWIGIDYLQYITSEVTRKNSSREQEIAQISRDLNALKTEFGLPIVCCAALNSDQDKRKDKRPTLMDFRDSKSAAYDADTALFLCAEPNSADLHRKVEFLLLKNRDGGLDEREMEFNKKFLLFQEPEQQKF